MTGKGDLVDLKSQYVALRDAIGARRQRVLDHGQYIAGPKVKEPTVFVDDRARLKAAGIQTAVHNPEHVHHRPAYAAYAGRDDCLNAVRVAARVLSLPTSADLSEAQQDRVAHAVRV